MPPAAAGAAGRRPRDPRLLTGHRSPSRPRSASRLRPGADGLVRQGSVDMEMMMGMVVLVLVLGIPLIGLGLGKTAASAGR